MQLQNSFDTPVYRSILVKQKWGQACSLLTHSMQLSLALDILEVAKFDLLLLFAFFFYILGMF